MAFTLGTSPAVNAFGATGTSITTATFAVTAGNLLCVSGAHEGASTTITATGVTNTTWSMGTQVDATDQHQRGGYILSAAAQASEAITINYAATRTFRGICVAQFSAGDTVSLDDEDTATATGVTSIETPSMTLTGSVGLIWMAAKAYNSGTWTGEATSPVTTLIAANGFHGHAYRTLSGAGSYTAKMNRSASTTITAVAFLFREGAGGGGTTSANLINSNLLAGRLLRGLKG